MAITHSDLDWKLSGKASGASSQTPVKQQEQSQSQESAAPKDKPLAEYRFKKIIIVEPAQGFVENKPFEIKGEVELIISDVTRPKVLVYPYGVYKGRQDKFVPAGIEAFIDSKTGQFSCTCKSLYYPDTYNTDNSKTPESKWELGATAEGSTAEKPMESSRVTLPQKATFTTLKKNDYDENGAEKYSKPKSGQTFKPNNIVKTLQADLIKIKMLPDNSADGFFGDKTDKAVREFQEYAMKTDRMKRKVGKVEQTGTKLQQAQPDGVVGPKTRDELDLWIKNDWIKPIAPIRHGEVDDKGVKNGKGKQDTEEHHKGSPIADIQQTLKTIGAYAGAVDGWFWGKMKDAIKLLQECGEKGEFYDANGNKVVLGDEERLKGHSPSVEVMDEKKIELAKKAEENGWKTTCPNNVVEKDIELSIKYQGSIPPIAEKAANVLREIMKAAGVESVIISSTVRTPEDQARIMYDNITNHGVAAQKKLYGLNGDLVIDVYSEKKKDGKSKDEIRLAMRDKIVEIGSTTVSKHCCDPTTMSIFDVAPSSVPEAKKPSFVSAIKQSSGLNKYFLPPEDPAYHMEVKL
jgi:peptidoglycan hydrolase-like protein with peptidoglycan-binding domain